MKIINGTTLTSAEFAETYYEQQVERHKNPDKWRGLRFGHPDLDHITGGVRRREFIVVAGAQKAGKTTAAIAWTLQFAREVQEDETVLFVSLEMSHSGIGGRVFANLTSIDVVKYRDYEIDDDEWRLVERGKDELAGMPILWNVGAYNIEGIEKIIEDNPNIRVIVIDYFQLMAGDSRLAKRYEQLEDLSRTLKQIAMQHDLSIVALSQQTRDALKSISRQKDPNTMAGTQALARDADMMLIIVPLVQDDEEIPHMREIWVALSRNSRAEIGVETVFIPKFARLGAPAPEDVLEMPESRHEQYWEKL